MRTISALIFITLAITGCSTKSAYDYFKMDPEYERTVSNLRTATIKDNAETEAIISTIYLNAVYPERFHGDENFLVALYQRTEGSIFTLLLNGAVEPLEIRNLGKNDPLLSIMPITNDWNHYYHVRYPEQGEGELSLKLGIGPSTTGGLTYQKVGQ